MDRAGPELLARLLDEHAAALELYARQWTECPEDVVQDALVELVRQSKLPDNVLAWLYRVVRNRSQQRSSMRRRQREAVAAERTAAWLPNQTGIDTEAAAAALAALPLDEREVVIAHVWGGLKFADIAVAVGTSLSTVHRRYERGLEGLRKKLGLPCLKNP